MMQLNNIHSSNLIGSSKNQKPNLKMEDKHDDNDESVVSLSYDI
jgi:hypothetical protein